MARYLTIVAATFALLTGGWIGLFQLQVGAPTETSRFVHDCLDVKHEAAHALEGRKALIMTGSSGFYGLRAETLGEVLGLPAVNMGVHAGLGLDYLVHQTQALVNPGDLVVMSLEYEHYWDEGRVNNVLLDYLVARDLTYFEALDPTDRIRSIFSMSLDRLWRGVSAVFVQPARRADDRYTCTANRFGDETRNTPERKAGANAAIIDALEARSYAGRLRPGAPAWAVLRRFAGWCREHDITLIATFPSLVRFDCYEQGGHKAFFDGVVTGLESADISVVGTPFEAMYERRDFFDSRYHLLAEPAARHTRRLAEVIRKTLAE